MAGWNYSWIAQLNWDRNSWTAPVDTARIPPRDDTGQATARQVSALVGRLHPEANAPVPLFVFDAGYDPISLTVACAATPAQLLVCIRDDRLFYAAPPDRCPGTAGRPRRHGAPFRCADPADWPVPDATLVATEPQCGRIEVTAWMGLHPRLSHRRRWSKPGDRPIMSSTVIRVDLEHLPRNTARAQKMLRPWWAGPASPLPDLDIFWRAYLLRFDIEHTLRFAKTTPDWNNPRARTPEQADDRWTGLVIAGYNHLRLARGLVAHQRLPQEPPHSPARLPRMRRVLVNCFWSWVPPPERRNPARRGQEGPKVAGTARLPDTPPSSRPPDTVPEVKSQTEYGTD